MVRSAPLLRSRSAGVLAAALAGSLAWGAPARAIVGGEAAAPDLAAHVVMIVSDRGSFCSATLIAPTLLLTAGHCVTKGASYRLLTYSGGKPQLGELGRVAIHPRFDKAAYAKRRFVIDLALVSLPAQPAGTAPLPLAAEAGQMGATYRIAGYGLARRGDGKTGGTLREASLVGVEPASKVQLRLDDPGGGTVGSCQGDSGGPVLREGRLVGVLASALGTDGQRGCGGVSGVALVGTALSWIRESAAEMGVALP
jgi:hypothetical protein